VVQLFETDASFAHRNLADASLGFLEEADAVLLHHDGRPR